MTKQIRRFTDWRTWLRSALAAAIAGGANGVTLMLVKPETFNFQTGWSDLWHVSVLSAIIPLALYLAKSPIPPIVEVEEEVNS